MNLKLTSALMLSAVTLACSSEKAPSPAPPTPAGAATVGAPAAGTTMSRAAASDTIGVPECDEYITKYEACVRDHVPSAQKPMVEQALAQYRTTWRSAAAQPAARASLAGACQQALTTARASMTAYGCQW